MKHCFTYHFLYPNVAYRNISVTQYDMKLLNDRVIDRFYGESERPVRWEQTDYFTYYRRRHRMGVQKDCFAYRVGRCSILTEMICRYEKCSFYKTKEQMEQDRARYGFDRDYKPKEKQK